MIGVVGGVLIGAAILLFVCTLVLNSLKDSADPGDGGSTNASREAWNNTNDTIEQIKTMLTVSCILLSVMGIVVVGSGIIGYIGGGFGG